MICPDCKQENKQGVNQCVNCGAELYDALMDRLQTKKLSRDQTRELKLNPVTSQPILLYIAQHKQPISVERLDGLIIGRADTANPSMPIDIDLTNFEAHMNGVSRQHAQLNFGGEPPQIVDLESYNGTYVNDKRLVPFTPHDLSSGDEIRFGRLVTRIYYK